MTYAYRAPSHPGMGYPGFVEPKPPVRIRAPADPSAFPRVDEELVRPETREELLRGRLVMAVPAKEPHADCQAEVVSLTRRGAAKGYVGATELLTCTGPQSNFATDACIRREGIDPASSIEDHTLAAPIPIRALLDAAEADGAVVQALYAKQVPAIMAIEAKELMEGIAAGLREGIAAVCEALGIPLDAERRSTMQALDLAGLRNLLGTLRTEHRWP